MSQLDTYNIIKTFGHCYDAGTVLLATRKNTYSDQNTYLVVKKYHLENSQREISLFLKVCFHF